MTIRIDGTTGISGVDGTATAPAVQGNDTNTGIFFPANDTIAFAEGGTEVMRIDANGNVGIGNTAPISRLHVEGEVFTGRVNSSLEGGQIGFGRSSDNARLYAIDTYGSGSSPEMRMFNDLGAIVFFSASPNGVNYIKFNPTQAAQGDANCLDDYEEGTWTPRIDSNNGQGTFTVRVGHYIKIGRKVTAWFLCDSGNSLAAGTTQYLTGLPFSIFSSYSGTTCVGQMGTAGPTTRTQQLMTLSANRGVAYVYTGNSQETTTITYASGVLEYLTDN